MPRVKQRTDALRERGVASALAVLAEQGVAGLTTRTVASRSGASVPAVYEVFGDKAGLIREIFFEGFRMLGDQLAETEQPDDPIEALLAVCEAFRQFVLANPVLAQTMFSRPFAEFDPTGEDNKAGLRVSKVFVQRARAAVEAGAFEGEPIDIAHVFFALVEGLAAAESANRLGGTKSTVDRRWRLALETVVRGLQPADALPRRPSRRSLRSASPVSRL